MSLQNDIEKFSPASYLPSSRAELVPCENPSTFEPLDQGYVAALFRGINALEHAAYLAPQMRDSYGILGKPKNYRFYCEELSEQRYLRTQVHVKTAEVNEGRGPHLKYEGLARFAKYGPRPRFTTHSNIELEPVKQERVVEFPKQASTLAVCLGAGWLALTWPVQAWKRGKDRLANLGKARPIGSVALSR